MPPSVLRATFAEAIRFVERKSRQARGANRRQSPTDLSGTETEQETEAKGLLHASGQRETASKTETRPEAFPAGRRETEGKGKVGLEIGEASVGKAETERSQNEAEKKQEAPESTAPVASAAASRRENWEHEESSRAQTQHREGERVEEEQYLVVNKTVTEDEQLKHAQAASGENRKRQKVDEEDAGHLHGRRVTDRNEVKPAVQESRRSRVNQQSSRQEGYQEVTQTDRKPQAIDQREPQEQVTRDDSAGKSSRKPGSTPEVVLAPREVASQLFTNLQKDKGEQEPVHEGTSTTKDRRKESDSNSAARRLDLQGSPRQLKTNSGAEKAQKEKKQGKEIQAKKVKPEAQKRERTGSSAEGSGRKGREKKEKLQHPSAPSVKARFLPSPEETSSEAESEEAKKGLDRAETFANKRRKERKEAKDKGRQPPVRSARTRGARLLPSPRQTSSSEEDSTPSREEIFGSEVDAETSGAEEDRRRKEENHKHQGTHEHNKVSRSTNFSPLRSSAASSESSSPGVRPVELGKGSSRYSPVPVLASPFSSSARHESGNQSSPALPSSSDDLFRRRELRQKRVELYSSDISSTQEGKGVHTSATSSPFVLSSPAESRESPSAFRREPQTTSARCPEGEGQQELRRTCTSQEFNTGQFLTHDLFEESEFYETPQSIWKENEQLACELIAQATVSGGERRRGRSKTSPSQEFNTGQYLAHDPRKGSELHETLQTIRQKNEQLARELIAQATARREAQTQRIQARLIAREQEDALAARKEAERRMSCPEMQAAAVKAQALFRGKQARRRTDALRRQNESSHRGPQPLLEFSSRAPTDRSLRSETGGCVAGEEQTWWIDGEDAQVNKAWDDEENREDEDEEDEDEDDDEDEGDDNDEDDDDDEGETRRISALVQVTGPVDSTARRMGSEHRPDLRELEQGVIKAQALYRGKQARRRTSLVQRQKAVSHTDHTRTSVVFSSTNSGTGAVNTAGAHGMPGPGATAAQRLGAMLGDLLASTVRNAQRLNSSHDSDQSNSARRGRSSSLEESPSHLPSARGVHPSPPLHSSDLRNTGGSGEYEYPGDRGSRFNDHDYDGDRASKFTSPYPDALRSQGLSSHPYASRASIMSSETNEAGITDGSMQSIFDGLEEANSILERFHHRYSPNKLSPRFKATQEKLQTSPSIHDYQDAAEKMHYPVVLNAYSDRSFPPWARSQSTSPLQSLPSPAPRVNSHERSNRQAIDVELFAQAERSLDEASEGCRKEWEIASLEKNDNTLSEYRPAPVRMPNQLNRPVLAALHGKYNGCVSWFLELDTDCDGYVSINEIISAARQLPCRLTTQEALEFAASIQTETHRDEDVVTLASLWSALHEPFREGRVARFDTGISNDEEIDAGDKGEGYAHYMPDLTWPNFQTEVLAMSRAAAMNLANVNKRCATLRQVIQTEHKMIKQDEQAFSTEYATKMFKEERRLAAALERERAASKAEARKTQAAANRLAMVQQQIEHWLAHHSATDRSPREHLAHNSSVDEESPRRRSLTPPEYDRHVHEGSAMRLTHPEIYADHTRTRQSSYQVHTDPRFSKQAGPRPPGGLHYLQNHFPQRHQAPAARSCIAESDIGNALGSLLHQEPKSSIAEVEIGRALGSLLHQEPKSFAHDLDEDSPPRLPSSSKTKDIASNLRQVGMFAGMAGKKGHKKEAKSKAGASSKRGRYKNSDSD